jgi:hypothetical protein
MDKSHIACFLGGAAIVSGIYWLTQTNKSKPKQVMNKIVNV